MKNIIFYLTVIGSIFVIVLYILGFSFYIGYVKGMGFDYSFFPLGDWNNAIVWAYFAAVYFLIDISKILMHVNPVLTALIILIIISPLVGLYSWLPSKREYIRARFYFWLLSKQERYPFIRRFLNPKVEKPLRAVEVSSSFLSNFFITIAVIVILIAIPLEVQTYGQSIGIEKAKRLLKSESLCESLDEFWNLCITVSTSHLKESNLPDKIEGRLIAKSETMLGIYTKDGPITMSMPEYIYYKSIENKCFDDGCKK